MHRFTRAFDCFAQLRSNGRTRVNYKSGTWREEKVAGVREGSVASERERRTVSLTITATSIHPPTFHRQRPFN